MLIAEGDLEQVKKDCHSENKEVVIPTLEEAITTYVEWFLNVYTYPSMLGLVDPVILDFCRQYQIIMGQIYLSVWRIVILLRFFVSQVEGMPFTLDHLIRIYNPRLYRGRSIRLKHRVTKVLFSSIDEDKDRGWMGRFVRVRTSNIIPAEKMSFPEEWNMKCKHELTYSFRLPFCFFYLFVLALFPMIQWFLGCPVQSQTLKAGFES